MLTMPSFIVAAATCSGRLAKISVPRLQDPAYCCRSRLRRSSGITRSYSGSRLRDVVITMHHARASLSSRRRGRTRCTHQVRFRGIHLHYDLQRPVACWESRPFALLEQVPQPATCLRALQGRLRAASQENPDATRPFSLRRSPARPRSARRSKCRCPRMPAAIRSPPANRRAEPTITTPASIAAARIAGSKKNSALSVSPTSLQSEPLAVVDHEERDADERGAGEAEDERPRIGGLVRREVLRTGDAGGEQRDRAREDDHRYADRGGVEALGGELEQGDRACRSHASEPDQEAGGERQGEAALERAGDQPGRDGRARGLERGERGEEVPAVVPGAQRREDERDEQADGAPRGSVGRRGSGRPRRRRWRAARAARRRQGPWSPAMARRRRGRRRARWWRRRLGGDWRGGRPAVARAAAAQGGGGRRRSRRGRRAAGAAAVARSALPPPAPSSLAAAPRACPGPCPRRRCPRTSRSCRRPGPRRSSGTPRSRVSAASRPRARPADRRVATRAASAGRGCRSGSPRAPPRPPARRGGRSRVLRRAAARSSPTIARVDVGPTLARRRQRLVDVAQQHRHRRVGVVERRLADEQLVGDAADRVEVGPRTDVAAPSPARAPCRRACRSSCRSRS